ncbi:MAG: RagB/SusD family nutrient uptake outer membrane protein [Phocaeicola sp.]|uniref:RagB/SusD family nutrient uptake outer membrane protein n=1 Tax=Phocaeicola sp. TaxID=2773926 RepID=UPI003FA08009
MKKIYIGLIMIGLASCDSSDFDRMPSTQVAESIDLFESESGLQALTNSFYYNFDRDDLKDDFISDNCEHIGNPPSIRKAIYTMPTSLGSGGWSWTQLRNINSFIDNCSVANVSVDLKREYIALAKFFRAKFYFEKVKTFGDVPWYSHKLNTDDDAELYKARDSRTLVMDSVLNDINYAAQYLSTTKSLNRITKWTVLAYKSRICLYEGTWRKYHIEAGLNDYEIFLRECIKACEELINSGQYKLYSTGNPNTDYASFFQATKASMDEVIYARSAAPGNYYYYTPNFTSTSNGNYGATSSLIEDYPMANGKSFAETYPDRRERETLPYYKEMWNRDPRLIQSIIYPGYIRIGTTDTSLSDFAENRTGYQITKRVGPPIEDQGGDTRDVIFYRYAEVLLNYAEAKAELGELNQSILDITINPIRNRVGLPSMKYPLTTDEIQLNKYKKTSDPNILEIRRERRIELAFEGFRTDDIKRWAEGHLFREQYTGIYISGLRTLIDLDNDGNPDLYVMESSDEIPSNKIQNVQYFRLSNVNGLTGGDNGRLIPYNVKMRDFEDWEYLDPIPTEEITLNPQLKQNPGWDHQ